MVYSQFNPNRTVYKVVLLGDGGVGKTSLRKRYLGEGFESSYMATIGADFAIKRIDDAGNEIIQIWDLAGQPRFSAVREAYYMGTKGAILTYDITRPDTFYNIPDWIRELLNNITKDDTIPLALVANKVDLKGGDLTHISQEQGEEYAKDLSDWSKLDVPYIETSAKTGFNVNQMFDMIVENINYRAGSRMNI
ncbi:MAG: GTP-binding protein [Candidatus Heimdallarchaeota archaeon]|nr:GTP-binding protein [Candidatus Heimdallarchaeota archaeon]